MIIAYFKAQIERVYIDVPIIIMVFFTCNACGQCVKKIHVEKHYLRECRNCEVLSCMDCGKDFFGDDYKLHTKCISENEKYGGKDYVASSKANKGEVKQSQWIECVQAASSSQSLGPRVKGLLERLANYDNIPRKKVKFERFLQNGLNVRDAKLIEQIWTVFSEAGAKQKNTLAAKAEEGTRQETEKTTQENGTSSGEQSSQGDTKADLKKTKKDKSHKERASDGGGDIVQDDGESTKSDKKKKKKKKKMEEENIEAEESDEERPCRDDAAKKSSKKRKHKKHQPEQVTLNGEEEEDGKAADEESGDAKKKKKHKHKKHGDESTHNGLRETTDATEETENGDSEPLKKRKGKKHRRTESQTLECEEKDAGIMKSVETEDSHDGTVSKKSKKKKHKIDEAEGELLKSELKRMIADDGALDLGSPKKKSKNKMDRVKEKSADHKKKKRKAADDSDGELKNLAGDDESEKRTSGGEKKKKKGAKDKKKDL